MPYYYPSFFLFPLNRVLIPSCRRWRFIKSLNSLSAHVQPSPVEEYLFRSRIASLPWIPPPLWQQQPTHRFYKLCKLRATASGAHPYFTTLRSPISTNVWSSLKAPSSCVVVTVAECSSPLRPGSVFGHTNHIYKRNGSSCIHINICVWQTEIGGWKNKYPLHIILVIPVSPFLPPIPGLS
jgi:hypothetical protein